MSFEKLSRREKEIVLQCMKATVAYIDDWEKQTRLGLEPYELKSVIDNWPFIDDANEEGPGFLAINNCLNEVCHGFYITDEDWRTWFDAPMMEIKGTYLTWLSLRGLSSGGIR